MNNLHKFTLAACAATLCSCGGVPKRTFTFDAIDTSDDARAAMIVLDQDWVAASQNKQFVNLTSDNELPLELTFQSANVEVTAVAIRTLDGTPVSVPMNPREAEEKSEYVLRTRNVQLRDGEKQLFIFERK